MTNEQTAHWQSAAELESAVYRASPGITGWGHSSYDSERRAWWQNRGGLTYQRAIVNRAHCIANRALLSRFGRDEHGLPNGVTSVHPWDCQTVSDVRRAYVREWDRAAAYVATLA